MSADIKALIKVFFDLTFIFVSCYIASSIFYGATIQISKSFLLFFIFNFFTIIPVNYYLKIYSDISRYFNFKNILYILLATLISFITQIIFIFILQYLNLNFSKTVLIFFKYQNIFLVHLFFFLFTINFRIFLRTSLNISNLKKIKKLENPCLIYGAGNNGLSAIKYITNIKNYNPIGFVDDDINKVGRYINNLPIISFGVIETYLKKNKIKKIFICLPSASSFKINEILKKLDLLKVEYEEIRSIESNKKEINTFDIKKNVIKSNVNEKKDSLYKNKKILITGAAGTIGEELCYQLINEQPSELTLIDSSEFGISNLTQKINKINLGKVKINLHLVNLCFFHVVEKVIDDFKPDFIFHAAAYKHVEIVEDNPISAVYNNLISLINILESSKKLNNLNFVFISTDKAVEPVNFMGKSKRLGEIITSSFNTNSSNSNKYCCVRFGNVIGSSGSLIPKIQNQINNNAEITVTDKKATRYFMTISDAINLTLQAIRLTDEGNIFVLNMGEAINIYELVIKIIKSSGRPDLVDKIKITGLRKGEKIHEKLFNKNLYKPSSNELFFIEKILNNLSHNEILDIKQKLEESLKQSDLNFINQIFKSL